MRFVKNAAEMRCFHKKSMLRFYSLSRDLGVTGPFEISII